MSTPACNNSIYFDAGTSKAFPDVNGMCRRWAPQGPVIGCQNNGWQLFPPMQSSQWCGEHRPLAASAAARAAEVA